MFGTKPAIRGEEFEPVPIYQELGEEETVSQRPDTDEQTDDDEQNNVLRLKHPIKIDGETRTELPYDFDALTANDLHKVSKELKRKGIPVTVPALDYEYQLLTFARAAAKEDSKVFLTDIMRLSAQDAMKATGLARDFLLNSDPNAADLTSGD